MKSIYDADAIRKQLRSVPKVGSAAEALDEILKLATDSRGHVLLDDDNAWKEIKLKAIAKLARRGKRLASA